MAPPRKHASSAERTRAYRARKKAAAAAAQEAARASLTREDLEMLLEYLAESVRYAARRGFVPAQAILMRAGEDAGDDRTLVVHLARWMDEDAVPWYRLMEEERRAAAFARSLHGHIDDFARQVLVARGFLPE